MGFTNVAEREHRASTLPLEELTFCAVDVETTGLFRTDRVVEIAMVRATAHGEVLEEFETLIHPGRSAITTAQIHGISDGDLRDAPSFREVAGVVAGMLDQAILVAHNASFDHRFIEQEFGRLGESIAGHPRICTLELGTRFGTPISGKLPDCCAHYGVPYQGPHRAADDVRAALGVLWRVLERGQCQCLAELGVGHGDAWVMPLPAAPTHLDCSGQSLRRDDVTARVVPMPHPGQQGADADGFAAYCALLAEALADRHLEDGELSELARLGERVGLSPAQAAEAATGYFAELADLAFADHHLSDAERSDLARVAELLGIDEGAAAELVADAALRAGALGASTGVNAVSDPRAAGATTDHRWIGKSVCFSGAPVSRHRGRPMAKDDAMALARLHGLVTMPNVTKKTDLLVVPDPNLITGKAARARRYGIPVLPEEVFWREVGVVLD